MNKEIVIELPDNASDIQGIEGLDPNDKIRMRIDRDGKNVIQDLLPIITVVIN